MIYAYEYNYSYLSGLHFYKYFTNAISTEVCQNPLNLQCHSVESLGFSILFYQLCVPLVRFYMLSGNFWRNQ